MVFLKQVLKNKKALLAAGCIILFLIIGFIYQSHKKVNVLSDVKVKFSGYNDRGTLSYNSDDIQKKINEVCLRKSGFNKSDTNGIIKQDDAIMSNISNDTKKSAQ